MIDVENLVINTTIDGIHQVYPNIEVTRGYIEENASFPCVVVYEIDNAPVQKMDTEPCAENFSRLTYNVEVYSDKGNLARSECRELLNLADRIMQSMKFRRQRMNEALNVSRTIFRQYARYTVIVQKGITTVNGAGEETTVFNMYRR